MTFGDPRLPARFWTKVRLDKESGCWVWTASGNAGGYGRITIKRRSVCVHRLAYEALVGPIPAETLDHLCRNRACVNPAHLDPVPKRVNTLRGISGPALNARKTHCPQGHPLASPNLRVRADRNERECRECRRKYGREWMRNKRATLSKEAK